jgi:protein-L-isoaspartate(D-aspartate) O-methyltransferase
MTDLARLRAFYAALVTAQARVRDDRIRAAFAAVPREVFCGRGPWQVYVPDGYIETPSDDPALLYQNQLIGLVPERGINTGEPVLHASCLGAVAVQPGETVLHVGAGTGYYTAILAELTGPAGRVLGYEVEADLAAAAEIHLRPWPQASVALRSGTEGPLPPAAVIYVNAGASGPAPAWLDALQPGGRLLFPLTGENHWGAMLLVTRRVAGAGFEAAFRGAAGFIHCVGGRAPTEAAVVEAAFARGGSGEVRSLRRGTAPDETAWVAGQGWWLSTAPP